MKKIWTDEDINYLVDNYNIMSLDDISYQLKCKKSQISAKLNKLKIVNRGWKENEDMILLENYPFKEIKEYRNLLCNRSDSSILNRAFKLGLKKSVKKIKKNKYEVNHRYFFDKNIDSCYWAGFIAADGFIDNNYSRIAIKLSLKDKPHLDLLKNKIKTQSPIRTFENKSSGAKRTFSQLDIFSKQIKRDLYSNFKIGANKTFTLQPPDIDDNLILNLSYITGLIDGDGTVCLNRHKKKSITLLGNFELLNWSKSQLNKIIDVSNISIIPKGNIYSFKFTGKRCDDFKKFIIDNKFIYLERKWNKI